MQYATSTTSTRIPNWLWRVSSHMRAAAHQSLRYAESSISRIGVVAAATFLIYYFVFTFIVHQSYESPTLRLLGSLVAFPIVFARRWPDWAKPYLPLYWIFTLTYCLPFFFTYMLLRSAQLDFETGQHSLIWPMSEVVALVLLIMLVSRRRAS